MTLMPIAPTVRYPDPSLLEKCTPFPIEQLDGGETAAGWRRYFEAVLEQLKLRNAYAIAAPQVGSRLRWFAIAPHPDLKGITFPDVFINPKVEMSPHADEFVTLDEGCLSLPGIRLRVERPRYVRISYSSALYGGLSWLSADGMTSRVIQHEIDHLDGVLPLDRTTPAERARVARALQAMEQAG